MLLNSPHQVLKIHHIQTCSDLKTLISYYNMITLDRISLKPWQYCAYSGLSEHVGTVFVVFGDCVTGCTVTGRLVVVGFGVVFDFCFSFFFIWRLNHCGSFVVFGVVVLLVVVVGFGVVCLICCLLKSLGLRQELHVFAQYILALRSFRLLIHQS